MEGRKMTFPNVRIPLYSSQFKERGVTLLTVRLWRLHEFYWVNIFAFKYLYRSFLFTWSAALQIAWNRKF